MLEWQGAKRSSAPSSWSVIVPEPLPGRRRVSPWVHPSSQTCCLSLWRSSSLACKLFSVVVAQICQCWQRWWFDGDIVDGDVQGEQRRRGRPECNAHGGRSAATAPTMSRRFSNRFSWLRNNMSLDVLTFTTTKPFLSKVFCEKCCLCKYNQDPSRLCLKKGLTSICESSLVAKYFPSLDSQPRWPFLQHIIKFSLSCLNKKKSCVHRERWYRHSSACSLWQWIKQIPIILKKSSSCR